MKFWLFYSPPLSHALHQLRKFLSEARASSPQESIFCLANHEIYYPYVEMRKEKGPRESREDLFLDWSPLTGALSKISAGGKPPTCRQALPVAYCVLTTALDRCWARSFPCQSY